MFFRLVFAFVILAAPACAVAQDPSHAFAPASDSLTVTLTGLRNEKGQIFIQLWQSREGFPLRSEKAYRIVSFDATKAINGTVSTTFTDIGPGTYAVSSLHDENRNGKMDSNAFGIPTEGWGVSNNVITRLHAPSFEQASFAVSASGQKISIALHY